MASLRDIQKRIISVKGTSKITSAMKMVAAANLKRGQRFLSQARPYFNRMDAMMNNLLASVGEDYNHPLLEKRNEIKKVAIMVISDDKGLCGAFNNNIFKKTEIFIKTLPTSYPGADLEIIPLGNKAADYFTKHYKANVKKVYRNIYKEMQFATLQEILHYTVDSFKDGSFDEVIFFYNDFVSVLRQESQHKVILPLTYEVKEEAETNSNYIYEPDKAGILDDILPLYIDVLFWTYFLSSYTAAQAARMMAMDNATVNAKEIIQVLQLQYNKARQASITNEMLEIVSGADALKG
jgi:F-type H+-transporting ATPase subunit gamma